MYSLCVIMYLNKQGKNIAIALTKIDMYNPEFQSTTKSYKIQNHPVLTPKKKIIQTCLKKTVPIFEILNYTADIQPPLVPFTIENMFNSMLKDVPRGPLIPPQPLTNWPSYDIFAGEQEFNISLIK